MVVSPGGEPEAAATSAPRTLAEASRAERERRAKSGRPVLKINDKNLSRHATGSLTVLKPEERPKSGEAGATAQNEAYWRQRGLEIRQRWRRTVDEIQTLEQRIAELRQRFYATDDPYVRDTQVKPDWDRALDRLVQARVEVEATRKELATFMEEGRRAGALPGWMRAGAELEPKEEAPKPASAEPQEPKIFGEKKKQ
ncbi:MAG TPA: hypothetical protein VHN15_09765 [Thermoanaerobaculia bacterium]|nr:hypothetical protein [Thermoanaerobaculia bacterium]